MDLHIFKLNNYVKYNGGLHAHNDRVGQITSVDRWNDEDTFELTLHKRYQNEPEVKLRAYMGEIRPISLDGELLIKNGFQPNEHNFYTKNNITIYRPVFIKTTKNIFGQEGRCWDDKGFRAINEHINDYNDEKEVLEKTSYVNSINALQNYFELKIGESLEFSL